MADLPQTLCVGCHRENEDLVVSLPRVGICADCLTERGWTLDSTADVLQRLGVGLLTGAQPGAAVTEAVVSRAGTAPDLPAWMRPRRTRFVVWVGTLEELAAYLTDMTDDREGGRRVYILRDEPMPASDRRRWLLEVNEPADEAPHDVARGADGP